MRLTFVLWCVGVHVHFVTDWHENNCDTKNLTTLDDLLRGGLLESPGSSGVAAFAGDDDGSAAGSASSSSTGGDSSESITVR